MYALARWTAGLLTTSLVAGTCFAGVSLAQSGRDTEQVDAQEASAQVQTNDEVRESVEGEVQAKGADVAAERRKSLINDAVEALDETEKALAALEEGDPEAALESLAIATGKLDLVVTRNPNMALAPIDVRLMTYDLHANIDDIEDVKERAAKHLKNGRLQDARALIEGLRSDVVVEVYNIPLATYPAAIKAIAPLIDGEELEKAKLGLQSALNTLVVTKQVHPLPIIRTELLLRRAEKLATTENRTDGQSERLTRLLDAARTQLQFAQALGYGQERDFVEFYEQLDEIAKKTGDGKSGTGFFDVIRNALRSFGGDSPSRS